MFRYFWHNIGLKRNPQTRIPCQDWWHYLVQKGKIATSFKESPGDRGEKLLREYKKGDVVFAYASKYGALGYGIIQNPSSYKLLSAGDNGDVANGYLLHRLDIRWKAVFIDIKYGIKASELQRKFKLKFPRQTKEKITSYLKVKRLIKCIKK